MGDSGKRAENGAPQPGSGRVLRIFVSSASGALAAYRQVAVEVCHRMQLTPVYMEEFDPQRPPPEQVRQREVKAVMCSSCCWGTGTRPGHGTRAFVYGA